MGTDIHGVFQARQGGQWVDIEVNWDYEPQSYRLFAVLAGVRSETAFPGRSARMHSIPIAMPRDLPDDFEMEEDRHLGKWMGEHSFSWLSGDEMLKWYRYNEKDRDFESLNDFFYEVQQIAEEYGEIRFVFGFDS